MAVDKALIAEALKALEIVDVYLRDEHVILDDDYVPPVNIPESLQLFLKSETRLSREFSLEGELVEGRRVENDYIEIEFRGEVQGRNPGSSDEGVREPAPLFSMDVTVALLYLKKAPCSDECISEFVKKNSPHHAIPYWREHVHAMCMKRRIPPITIPMYKPGGSTSKKSG